MSYSLQAVLEAAAEHHPDRVVARSVTAERLLERVRIVGSGLRDRGMCPGDRIGIALADPIARMVTFLGAVCIGVLAELLLSTDDTVWLPAGSVTFGDLSAGPAADLAPWEQAVHSGTPAAVLAGKVLTHGELLDLSGVETAEPFAIVAALLNPDEPVYREDDGELLGYLRPANVDWQPLTVFGVAIGEPQPYDDALDLLSRSGMECLVGTWWYHDADDWYSCVIVEADQDQVVLKITDFGHPKVYQNRTVNRPGPDVLSLHRPDPWSTC